MPEPTYSDVLRATRGEKIRIWFAWLCGGIIWALITNGTRNVAIVSVITQVLLIVLGILSTIAAVTMTRRLNRRLAVARREVLGE
jgi:energy-converting hydrogenase Eha subunit C